MVSKIVCGESKTDRRICLTVYTVLIIEPTLIKTPSLPAFSVSVKTTKLTGGESCVIWVSA